MDLWLYHEKDAPNGELLRGVSQTEVDKRLKGGWKDTPTGFKKTDPDAPPPKTNEQPPEPPAAALQLEAMEDGELIEAIDDMDRQTVEKHIEARSIDRGEAVKTSELRGVLIMHVRPGIMGQTDEKDDIDPAPQPKLTNEQLRQVPSLAALKDMEPDARNARIEALTDDQLDEALKAANVQVKRNATIAAKRAGLKAYFS